MEISRGDEKKTLKIYHKKHVEELFQLPPTLKMWMFENYIM